MLLLRKYLQMQVFGTPSRRKSMFLLESSRQGGEHLK